VNFRVEDFTETSFENESFDAVIAIESMSSAPDKKLFLNEMRRILKPKGNILIADLFKSYAFAIDEFPVMNTMLNGWAIADLLTMNESQQIFADSGFHIVLDRDVTREIEPTVRKTYYACMLGALPTWLYQLTHNASYYSKNHYKTGIAQYKAYKKSLWNYHLLCLEKT
jgi:ubiquinone/menaquinone biosynthesis C-methylase UbiE